MDSNSIIIALIVPNCLIKANNYLMIADEKMQESSSEPPSSPFHHPQGKSFEYCYYFSYLVISLITKISIDTLGPRY